jgi:murein DD-endopeptidase MepM/ murein hydrolase activator NlpD
MLNKGVGGPGGASIAGMIGAGLAAATGNAVALAALTAGTRQIQKMATQSFGPMYGNAQPGEYGNIQLDAEQLGNATRILNVGKQMGATPRDLIISIMTAMQESGLRNLHGGDADSQGLFQQRPSMGWGTVAQVTNPEYAARQFFEHLLAIKDREKMTMTQAAQRVQRSAFPDAYAKWEDMARAVAAGSPLSGEGGGLQKPVIPIRITRNFEQHNRQGMDLDGVDGQPIYAMAPGRVATSAALYGTNPYDDDGYRSYGEYVVVQHPGGISSLYAHMLQKSRRVREGDTVGAGSVLGLMGSTGNSSGSHLHFETRVNGNMTDPQRMGIPGLRTGGTVKYDNTIANLHADEKVLTAPLSRSLERGIDKMDNSGYNKNEYHFNFDGANFNKDIDVKQAVKDAIREMDSARGHNRRIN